MGWPPPLPLGPTVLPGTYTLKLTAGGKSQTQTLTVLPDPRSKVPTTEREEGLKTALALRADVARLARMVHQIRALHQQITARNQLLKDVPKAEPLVKLGKEILDKLDSLEGRLHNPKARVPYDLLAHKGGAKLYSQLNNLYYLAIDCEGIPTQGLRELYAEYRQELHNLSGEFRGLTDTDLAKLNDLAKKLDLAGVLLPSASGSAAKKEE
jgi:hypothetical protein